MKTKYVLGIAIAILLMVWSTLALAQDVNLSQADVDSILALMRDKKWAGLIGLVIFTVVRFFKDDVKPEFLSVPARYRIWIVWILSITGCVADKVAEGIPWRTAIVNMTISLVISVVVLHQTFIASIRAGKEITVPGLTIPGARPSPTAPATMTPPDPPPIIVPGSGDGGAIEASIEAQANGTGESRDSPKQQG